MVSPVVYIKQVCDELNIGYREIEPNFLLDIILTNNHHHLIMDNCLGLNLDVEAKIMRDKYGQYLLLKDSVNIPEMIAWFDPDPPHNWPVPGGMKTIEEMVSITMKQWLGKVVVKPNGGTKARNLSVCENELEVKNALEKVFNHNQLDYCHIAVAQQYVEPKHEYRVMTYQGKVKLIHYKYHKDRQLCGLMSVSQWQNEHAKFIEPKDNVRLVEFVENLMSKTHINYCGLDIMEDIDNKLWLIELNGTPLISENLDVRYNVEFLNLYREIVIHLKHKYENS